MFNASVSTGTLGKHTLAPKATRLWLALEWGTMPSGVLAESVSAKPSYAARWPTRRLEWLRLNLFFSERPFK
jgi:hypothetical protein